MDIMRYKYPRTYHFPYSPGRTSDDKVLPTVDHFVGQQIVVTEKMDGECTSLYPDYLHARSIDGRHHPSRNWVKALHGRICHNIPTGMRICGENLYATHSIHYTNLPSYFMAFSIWNEHNICLDWDSTVEICQNIGLVTVPVLWRGEFDEQILRQIANDINVDQCEGYVVRLADEFHFDNFNLSLAKYVRAHHVQTEDHWMTQTIIPNELKI